MWRKRAPADICPKGITKTTTSDKTAHTWIKVKLQTYIISAGMINNGN